MVRLYEDLLNILPHVLEPVPATLVPYTLSGQGRAWEETFELWFENQAEHGDQDQFWLTAMTAKQWTDDRKLDALYLSPSTRIFLWSDESMVHLEWDNRDKLIDGVQAWTAVEGTFVLPRKQFLSEVQSFHSRLMEQMAERVKCVAAGALNPDITVDLPGLRREHEFRCLSLDRTRETSIPPTDWRAVLQAIREVERIIQSNAN